jgi:hypothetical protein
MKPESLPEYYQAQIRAKLSQNSTNEKQIAAVDSESDLQSACERWLSQRGYRRLTKENAVLEGNPVGWWGHLNEPKKNPFMADIFIFDGHGRCLMVELKHGKICWGIGQLNQVQRNFWFLATTLDEFQDLVQAWEQSVPALQ